MKDKLINMMIADLTAMRWITGWIGLMYGIGLISTSIGTEPYLFLYSVMSGYIWAFMFGVYGIIRILSSLNYIQVPLVRVGNCILGLILWSFTLISFLKGVGINATDFIYCTLIYCEIWGYAQFVAAYQIEKGKT